MALSNWLTRGEWNAAYMVGVKHFMDQNESTDLGRILTTGLVAMHKSGYRFKGITVNDKGEYNKVKQVIDGGNETVLVEFLEGTFDYQSRAKEALDFADKHLPNMDFNWLREALRDKEIADSAGG